MTALEVGTREEAARNGWISMKEGIDIHGHDGWLHKIVNLTCLNEQDLKAANYERSEIWKLFEYKIIAPAKILVITDIFEKYTRHILRKYKKNGYQRIQFRFAYRKFKIYDQEGRYQRDLDSKEFFKFYQKILDEETNHDSERFFGWIECGYKFKEDAFTQSHFRVMCEADWKLLIGFDFVNE